MQNTEKNWSKKGHLSGWNESIGQWDNVRIWSHEAKIKARNIEISEIFVDIPFSYKFKWI